MRVIAPMSPGTAGRMMTFCIKKRFCQKTAAQKTKDRID
jgi:hypothetical protein